MLNTAIINCQLKLHFHPPPPFSNPYNRDLFLTLVARTLKIVLKYSGPHFVVITWSLIERGKRKKTSLSEH